MKTPPHHSLTIGIRSNLDKPVTLDRIQKALVMSAEIVARYGQDYLPIFERLEREEADFLRKNEAFNRALTIAEGFDAHIGDRKK